MVGEDGYIIFEDIDVSVGFLMIDGIIISSEDLV